MATEDLSMKFGKLVNQLKRQFNETIEEEKGKLMAEIQGHKPKKQRMEAFVDTDDDIIDLNVGGEKLSTRPDLLFVRWKVRC